jgi:hypothetical protein
MKSLPGHGDEKRCRKGRCMRKRKSRDKYIMGRLPKMLITAYQSMLRNIPGQYGPQEIVMLG